MQIIVSEPVVHLYSTLGDANAITENFWNIVGHLNCYTHYLYSQALPEITPKILQQVAAYKKKRVSKVKLCVWFVVMYM